MTVDAPLLAELGRLRRRLPGLLGCVVATIDGMLLAHDLPGQEPDGVAALSAAHLGLAQRFADTVGHGALRETVVVGERGNLTTYAAGDRGLLAVLTEAEVNLARVHLEARRVAGQVGELLDTAAPAPAAEPAGRSRRAPASGPTGSAREATATGPAPPVPATGSAPTMATGSVPPLARRTPMATLLPNLPAARGAGTARRR